MPAQEEWEQGQWEIVAALFERVAHALGEADCTLIADRGLSCLRLIGLCQAHGWHYVLRINQDEYAQRKRYGTFGGWQTCSQIVAHTGQPWFGTVRLWQEHEFETKPECGVGRGPRRGVVPDFGPACWAQTHPAVSLAHAGRVHLSGYEKSWLAGRGQSCTPARS
jgi:hypothetical protein